MYCVLAGSSVELDWGSCCEYTTLLHYYIIYNLALIYRTTSTIYIVEIATTDMRGQLGCFLQFMGGIGVLVTFILGAWCNWWQLAAAMMVSIAPLF